ncbi:MAG: hypothetical protein ACFE9T_16610, partial [Promethearchaeota archaeon]
IQNLLLFHNSEEDFFIKLVSSVYDYLKDNTVFLIDLSQEQINLVKKFTMVIFLLLQRPPLKQIEIHQKTGLGIRLIRKIDYFFKERVFKRDIIFILNNLPFALAEHLEIKDEIISVYENIIQIISHERNGFYIFYKNLPHKNASYIVSVLIYYYLLSKGLDITQNNLISIFNIEQSYFNKTLQFLSNYMKKIPKYKYIILEDKRAHKLNNTEYLSLVHSYIKKFLNKLSQVLKHMLSIPDMINLFNKTFNLLDENYFSTFYNDIIYKSPKLVASSFCYYYLKYQKDFILTHNEFILFLKNSGEKLDFNKFNNLHRQLMINYYKFNNNEYRAKLIKYMKVYVKKVRDRLKKSSKSLIEKLNKSFIDNALEIFDYALNNNFEIIYFSESGIFYYYPQIMASSLVFFTSRSTEGLENILTRTQNFDLIENYDYVSNISINRLYPFIKDFIGRYKKQHYSKDDFIEFLRKSLEEFFHFETFFLLQLYNLSELAPHIFSQKLNIYGGYGTQVIKEIVNQRRSFTYGKTFKAIEKFIKTNLTNEKQKKILPLFYKLRDTRYRNFVHKYTKFQFRYIKKRIHEIGSTELSDFFNGIIEGFLLEEIFNNESNPRASLLYLSGESGINMSLKANTILNFLGDSIKIHNLDYFLSQEVQKVFETYNLDLIAKVPHHPAILTNILLNNNYALAIEIPIWIRTQNVNEFFTGHIDLILILENTILIADYKPESLGVMIKSIPQIWAYAVMMRKLLKLRDFKIKCVGFSKDGAIEFDPESITEKLFNFIRIEDMKRKQKGYKPLRSRPINNSKDARKNRVRLIDNMTKLYKSPNK